MKSLQALVCLALTVGLACGCNDGNKTDSETGQGGYAGGKTSPPRGNGGSAGGKTSPPQGNGGQPKRNGQNKLAPTGIQGTWVITPTRKSSSGNIIEYHYVFSGNTFTASIGVKGAPRRKTRAQGTFRIDKAKGVIHKSVRIFSGRNNTPGPVIKSTQPYQIQGNTLTLGEGKEVVTLTRRL